MGNLKDYKRKSVGVFFVMTLVLTGIFVVRQWYFSSDRIHAKQNERWKERISSNQYREYVPLVFQQDQLMEAPNLSSIEHIKNVVHVLKFYGETWKIEQGKLLVSNNVDKEILWNYTTKANDSIWLAEHPIEN